MYEAKTTVILLAAAALDALLGDPVRLPHPVQLMGAAIAFYVKGALALARGKLARRLAGILLAIALIGGSGAIAGGLVAGAKQLQPIAGIIVEIILLASCFAGRSLRRAAEEVLVPLEAGQLAIAREKLSNYVGRDTDSLDREGIVRAVLETVTENATDGVTAPLFYAIAGAFLPGVGSVPLAIAYKAASTLDSTVGYRREPYTDLGWASAKIEDILTWLPCRLTVFTLGLLSGHPQPVWSICRRDAPQDPSPNAGWSECAFAAQLGVQLGGTNYYGGVPVAKPLLGDARVAIAPIHVWQALRLTRRCFLLWLVLAAVALGLSGDFYSQLASFRLPISDKQFAVRIAAHSLAPCGGAGSPLGSQLEAMLLLACRSR